MPADERGRSLLVEVLNKENINPSSSGHSMLLPGAGRWMTERAGAIQAPPGGNCKRILWFMGLRAEAAAQFEYYRCVCVNSSDDSLDGNITIFIHMKKQVFADCNAVGAQGSPVAHPLLGV